MSIQYNRTEIVLGPRSFTSGIKRIDGLFFRMQFSLMQVIATPASTLIISVSKSAKLPDNFSISGIVEHGIADAETVDTAIKNSFGLRLPQLSVLENSDMVGTQLTYNIHSYVLPDLEDSHEPSPLLQQMLAEGKLGFQSGKGFKTWTPEQIDACNANLNEHLIRMLYVK